MPTYREDLVLQSSWSDETPADLIECIQRLSLELSPLDELEVLMPKAFACLASVMELHSVTIIEGYSHRKSLRIWFDNFSSRACVRDSLAAIRTSYRDLIDPNEHFHSDDQDPKLLSSHYPGIIRQTETKLENRLIFPLFMRPGQSFGLIQVETAEAVDQDKSILAIFTFLASRIASAIDRDALLHYQRKILSAHYSASVKLLELERIRGEAVAASTAKSHFLANMSHEIRTPLSLIIGFSDLLCGKDITQEERETFQRTIQKNSQLLARLIDDILDISKIEEGKIDLDFKDFSLPELLSDIEASFTKRAQDKGLFFRIQSEATVPKEIRSDPFRLKQILINVVCNAIKFTDQGGVTMNVRYSPPDPLHANPQDHLIRFEIQDTGIGMCPDEARTIFQPFTQAKRSIASRYGGTGLGLVLARQLAKALGGDLVLRESIAGEGSLFEVSISHRDGVSNS